MAKKSQELKQENKKLRKKLVLEKENKKIFAQSFRSQILERNRHG